MFNVCIKEPIYNFYSPTTGKILQNPIRILNGKYYEKNELTNKITIRDKIFEKKLFDFKNKYPKKENINMKIYLENIDFEYIINFLQNDSFKNIKNFIWRINDTTKRISGYEIIHLVFKFCSIEIMKEIIKKYMHDDRNDYNTPDMFGNQIIHYVTLRNNKFITFVKKLYDINKFDKNPYNNFGRTPTNYAKK